MGFLIAAALPVLAVVGTITVAVIVAITGIADLGTIEGSDGSVTFTVPDAGAYDCYAEGDGFQPAKRNFENMDLVATATPGGSITVARPTGTTTYNVDNGTRRGIAIRTIQFPAAGTYTLTTQWKDGIEPPGPKIVSRLKFGRMNLIALGASILGGCCTTVIAIVIAIIVATTTWKKRSNWDKLYGPSSAAPMASYPQSPRRSIRSRSA